MNKDNFNEQSSEIEQDAEFYKSEDNISDTASEQYFDIIDDENIESETYEIPDEETVNLPQEYDERGKPIEKKKKVKKGIIILLILLLLTAGIIIAYFILYTPSVQFAVSAEKFLSDNTDDYSLFDNISNIYKIHSSEGRVGITDSDIKFSVSSNGTLLDTIFASYMNKWNFSAETKSDGNALSGAIYMDFGKSENEFMSFYHNKDFASVGMFGSEYALSLGNPTKILEHKDKDSKNFFRKMTYAAGKAGNEDIFSVSYVKFDTAFGDSKWCKKVSLDMDGNDAQELLTYLCDQIEENDELLRYFSDKTYGNEEITREKLAEFKDFFTERQNYTLEISFYNRFGKIIAANFEASTGESGKKLSFCIEICKNENDGYDRHVVIANELKEYTINSSTSGNYLKCSDTGTITVEKEEKTTSYDYSIEHTGTRDGDGSDTSLNDELLISTSKDSLKQYTISVHNFTDEGMSSAASEIIYNSKSLTLGVNIKTSFTESSEVTPKSPGKIIQITDESGLLPDPEFKEKIEELKSMFWESDVFKSLKEGSLIPQNVFENILFKLFGVNEEAETASTGQNKAENNDYEKNNSDIQETETETETEFVYVPEEETKPDRDSRTWEEIQEDDSYSSAFWERFWGYYWSDDGYYSNRYDNIIDYFYDFVEKYF